MKKLISGASGVVLLLALMLVGTAPAFADSYDLGATFTNGVTLTGLVNFDGGNTSYTLNLSNSSQTAQCSSNCTFLGLFSEDFLLSGRKTENLLGFLAPNSSLLFLDGFIAKSASWTTTSGSSTTVPEGPVFWQLGIFLMFLAGLMYYRPAFRNRFQN